MMGHTMLVNLKRGVRGCEVTKITPITPASKPQAPAPLSTGRAAGPPIAQPAAKSTPSQTVHVPATGKLAPGSTYRGVQVKHIHRCSNGGTIVISQGNCLDFEGDAIVNAANQKCLGGGPKTIDGQITSAGGPAMAT